MSDELLVFTGKTDSYVYSSELSLCLRNFEGSLPAGASLMIAEGDTPKSLRDLIVRHQSEKKSGYVLILKEPSMLMPKGTVETLIETLGANPGVSCVLPSDIRGYRSGMNAAYYTLRGFERFVSLLKDGENQTLQYDGREPFMFLLRTDVFNGIEVPENPLDIPRVLPAGSAIISLNAYVHPFLDYYQETRSDVLPYIPKHLKSLLDIGCTRGYFGETVKKNRGCRVVGIEMNLHEAREAYSRLDRVIEGDILSVAVDESFDCVTCLDVIEHIINADEFLERVKALLHADGRLVLSVPNVGHWSVVEDLLAGRWDYVPTGTVCISHLRFFTKRTIENMLRDNGFRVVATGEEKTPLPDTVVRNVRLLQEAGLEVDEISLASLRYYIVAQKSGSEGSS